MLALMVGVLSVMRVNPVQAGSQALRISQAYAGGGIAKSPYRNDFIEIFNSSNKPVSLAGMSIQNASATGTDNFGDTTLQITPLPDVLLAAGQYYLVQGAVGTTGVFLPEPYLIDSTPINLSGSNGKVALVNSQASLGCNGG